MKKYHIRYNTQKGESDFAWRIFEDGTEFLVKNIKIEVSCFNERTMENGIEKHNIACYGRMIIIDHNALII